LGVRYQILPYFYSLFYQASLSGAMVVRPLWATFPSDSIALTVQKQFMLGSALLVSPVVDEGMTTVSAYFPATVWYQYGLWQKDSVVGDTSIISSSSGVWKTLAAPLTAVNVHVQGGSVLPLQQAALTTTAGRKTPFTLVAALCPGGKAFGSLFWDDGEQVSLSRYLTMAYTAETHSASSGYFSASVTHNSYADTNVMPVQEVVVVGSTMQAPTSAVFNGKALSSDQFEFDAQRHTLRFSGLTIELSSSFKLEWN
jgi:alpha-glucosidase (family GH31 glycosyl hydrolase)